MARFSLERSFVRNVTAVLRATTRTLAELARPLSRGPRGGTAFVLVLATFGAHCASSRTLLPAEPSFVEIAAGASGTSLATTTSASRESEERSGCPEGMVLVFGNYCPQVQHRCARGAMKAGRCTEYAEPATCLSRRVGMRFCIDREAYAAPGETQPLGAQSWKSAQAVCASTGKRLCLESEWQFACEGEEMRPFPHGFTRESEACALDLAKPRRSDASRLPTDAFPECLSPFGAHNMVGDGEEWTNADRGRRATRKGASWIVGRTACRAGIPGPRDAREAPFSAVRCCRDAAP